MNIREGTSHPQVEEELVRARRMEYIQASFTGAIHFLSYRPGARSFNRSISPLSSFKPHFRTKSRGASPSHSSLIHPALTVDFSL